MELAQIISIGSLLVAALSLTIGSAHRRAIAIKHSQKVEDKLDTISEIVQEVRDDSRRANELLTAHSNEITRITTILTEHDKRIVKLEDKNKF